MKKFRKFVTRLRSTLLILVLALGQVVGAAGPFLPKANASPTKITAKTHQGQKSDLSYTSGNITEYTEGDNINFRFTLEATHGPTSGELEVRFTGDDSTCTFFDGSFVLGAINATGPAPTVTLDGAPVATDFGTSNGEWVQKLDISYPSTFDHASNEAVVNYTIKLSDEAGECNGSSQHSRLNPSGGTVEQTGAQNVPVPANQIIELPEIFVEKWVDTTGDGNVDRRATAGEWSFSLDGGTAIPTDSNGKVTFTNVTPDGNHTVTESNGPAGQEFLGGSSPDQTCTFDASGVATATVTSGTTSQDATCIFNNGIQQGTITLIKNVINDHGGTAGANDFGLSTGGTSVNSGQTLTLTAGSYAINEAGLTGYSFVNITGTGCPAQLGGNVTLAPGQNVTCTITNDDIAPLLTVIKHVINDGGGNAVAGAFTMNVTATQPSDSSFPGEESPGTTITLDAGSYSVDENAVVGYEKTLGTDCSGSIAIGQHKYCTITNDDIAPVLQLMKRVLNDNGGGFSAEDWILTAQSGGDAPIINEQGTSSDGGETAITDLAEATAGLSYTLSELGPAGYTASSWSCDGGTLVGSDLTLSLGEVVICTITNDDQQAYIIVNKTVVNDNGGSALANDFDLTVDGNAVLDEVAYAVNPGTHTVGETNLPGYTAGTWGGDCAADATVSVALGETKTCTITNDDQQATITVVKEVTNDNGGAALPDDFDLTLEGNPVSSGVAVPVNPGTYTAGETNLPGYTFEGFTTDCDSAGDTTVALGENKTCTLTNNDQQSYVVVNKSVTNDNGGSASPDDFNLTVDNNAVLDEVAFSVNPGTHTAGETNLPGYTAGTWGGDCDAQASVAVALGETKTCTITNDDDAPSLTLVKEVTTDNGGTAVASDWTLSANGPTGFSGAGPSVSNGASFDSGTYDLSESGGPVGYTASDWVCVGGTQDDGDTISLGLGESATCTITNDDQAPSLTLVKEVVNDNSGTASADDWTLTADPTTGDTVSGDGTVTEDDAQANTPYSLSEDGPSGYFVKTDWDCTGAGGTFDAQANTITLALNADVTCTIINDDDAHPDILLTKTGPAAAHEGDEVIYNFSVENTGDEPLANVTINDPLLSNITYVSGDTNTNDILDVDETWQFTGSYTIPENQIADVYNTATVCGDPRVGEEVCDDDDHNIDILHPSITVEKSGPAYGHEGQLIGYDFIVTNTGDTTLYNVTINDDIATGESCEKNVLTAGESMDCTASYLIAIPTIDNVINNVDACGTDVLQLEVCDDDDHELDVLHPSIQIVKTGPAEAHEGDNVTYTFTVTNTGDIALSNTTVADDIAGIATYVSGDTNSDDKLDLTETWIYTADFVIPSDQEANVDNTATACGIDPLQLEVCDEDDHTLDVLHPSIHVEKTGSDAANPEDTVTYTFTVTNSGDTPLDITLVSDNVAGDGVYQSGDTNDNLLLDLTEIWVYTVDYVIPADQDSNINNTVTVCADDSLEAEVCDEDDHTLVVLAKVKVTKYNDYNRNGQYDPDETELVEPTLPGWEFNLNGEQNCEQFELFVLLDDFIYEDECQGYSYDKTQTTGDDGTTMFTGVRPGIGHELSETLQDGWQLSNIHCSGDERGIFEEDEYYVYASPGDTVECFVGNYQDTVLLIEKSNNRPNPTDVGDTVTYTIEVTVPENSGPSYNTTVTDLPPEGFSYVPGSWTANSSVRGNLKPGTTTEPTYASPGLWQLGNLLPGEVVTLTYKALIASTVSSGTYPDVAFALGCETPTGDCEVLSNVSAGADTPFVATKVTIKSPQVLAATILVNTGVADMWRTMMAATLLMGLALATSSVRRQKKGATL